MLQPQTPLHRPYRYMSKMDSRAFSNPMLSQNLIRNRLFSPVSLELLSILLLAALFLSGNICAQPASGGTITGHVEGPGGISVPGRGFCSLIRLPVSARRRGQMRQATFDSPMFNLELIVSSSCWLAFARK